LLLLLLLLLLQFLLQILVLLQQVLLLLTFLLLLLLLLLLLGFEWTSALLLFLLSLGPSQYQLKQPDIFSGSQRIIVVLVTPEHIALVY
jgi:hypothetical protein